MTIRAGMLLLLFLISTVIHTHAQDPEFLENLELTGEEKKWLEQMHVVKVHPDTWPPFNFWDDNENKNRGIAPDYLRWIEDKTGLRFEYIATQMSLNHLLKEFKKKNIDLSPSLQYQIEREAYLKFTEPYYESHFGLFVMDIQQLPSKNHLVIACEKSSATHNYITENYPGATIVPCATEKDGLLMLSQGRVNCHAGNVDVNNYLIAGSGEFNHIQLWQHLPIEHQHIHMAVRKDMPQLASIIDKCMLHMPVSVKNSIINKYDKEVFWIKNKEYFILAGITLILMLIVLIITMTRLNQRNKKIATLSVIAREKAEESARFRSMFLANMSHEIRSPMNAILGLTALLKADNLTAEEEKKYLSFVEKSGKQLLTLINDILDLSKLESGEIILESDSFDLKELLEEIHITFHQLAQEKNLKLEVNDFSRMNELYINSDRAKISQVLINLVSNAIKYTDYGKVTIGYSFDNNNHLVFYVKDTGNGIPEDMRKHIFDRFERLEKTRHIAGTGLGLAISKNIVKLLKGNIWVESNQKAGSIFYFSIPLHQSLSVERKGEIVPLKNGPYVFNHQTILLAEDQDNNFYYLSTLLEKAGLEVIRAHDGTEAIKLVKENHVDLVLMDIKMPLKSGYEACRAIKKYGQKIPVIMQTACAMPEEKKEAYRNGCDDYLVKPINKDELIGKLKKYLFNKVGIPE